MLLGHNIVRGGIYGCVGEGGYDISCKNVYLGNAVYLVPEKFHTDSIFGGACGEYLHHISPYTEFVADKVHIIALILYLNKPL